MNQCHVASLVTPRGIFYVEFGEKGIYRIHLPGAKPPPAENLGPLPWPLLGRDLKRYLAGEVVDWHPYPLDCSGYSPFTVAVLRVTGLIPHGETRTYRQVAAEAGRPAAWRAAGGALGANRHPLLVPCHRVIRSDGRYGGFSGPAGWKEQLLDLERRGRNC